MDLLETIESIVFTLKSSDTDDLIATETLTGKKIIFETDQILAKAGDYEKSEAGNKQAQRRMRKSMAVVAMIAKKVADGTKK